MTVVVILISLALVTIFFIRGEKTTITNYPSRGVDIIVFGDSLVEGVGATEGNDFVSLLSRQVGRPIVNLGRSGDTTAMGLARLATLDHYKPKVVLVLLGGNDYLRKVPSDETFANLGKIIEGIQSRGAVVLLLGIRGGIFGDRFEEEFQLLANTHGAAYVPDVLDGLFGNAKYMSDPIHPNDIGYAKIAERIYPELRDLLN